MFQEKPFKREPKIVTEEKGTGAFSSIIPGNSNSKWRGQVNTAGRTISFRTKGPNKLSFNGTSFAFAGSLTLRKNGRIIREK